MIYNTQKQTQRNRLFVTVLIFKQARINIHTCMSCHCFCFHRYHVVYWQLHLFSSFINCYCCNYFVFLFKAELREKSLNISPILQVLFTFLCTRFIVLTFFLKNATMKLLKFKFSFASTGKIHEICQTYSECVAHSGICFEKFFNQDFPHTIFENVFPSTEIEIEVCHIWAFYFVNDKSTTLPKSIIIQ